MYNENYLIFSDVLELEEAGLDVDELADMDWDDRYDAIDEAGLNPLDYEYGFLHDEYSGNSVSTRRAKRQQSERSTISTSQAPARRVKGMSRRERKKIQKEYDDLETTLDALLGLRL